MAQGYNTQIPEKIENTVTEKLSKEFSRTESRILGASSCLSLMNFFWTQKEHPGTAAQKTGNPLGIVP